MTTNKIITDVKQAKAAYDDGKSVHVDVNAKPLRFIIQSTLGCLSLDYVHGGDWYMVDDDDDERYSSQVVFKLTPTSITSIKDLADFIQSGGGDCHVGSLFISRADAIKAIADDVEFLYDIDNPDRYVVTSDNKSEVAYVCDYFFGGDWDYIELKDEPIEVEFLWSLSHQAECRYDVQKLRVTESDLSCIKLDEKYGGNWLMFDRLTATTIAKFAAKAQEGNNNA
jgi:hypothetical protein